MNRYGRAAKLLSYTVGAITGMVEPEGAEVSKSLSGISLLKLKREELLTPILEQLKNISKGDFRYEASADEYGEGRSALAAFINRGVGAFLTYYSRPDQAEKVDGFLKLFEGGVNPELLAEGISKVWTPELEMTDDEILERWKLQSLQPNPRPLQPHEVVLQLNALYTLPEVGEEHISEDFPKRLRESIPTLRKDPGLKVADYDHPVPLFEEDEKHELISCLEDLDKDVSFEKEREVLPRDHKLPVLLSVSVTHAGLDEPVERWIEWLLEKKHYRNLHVIVMTESKVRQIKATLLERSGGEEPGEDPLDIFSVFGKYARHFNVLKYSQLLLERAMGIRAGFKLDTDEGIRSRDLFQATGKTWFETLCHPYWGGSGVDWQGNPVELAINEGEYINSIDIEKLGYENSLRAPDVAVPNSWKGPSMFFQKSFAHGRTTALYNSFDKVEEGISHTVVKGGGYGITNDGLRKAVPFTFSWVGRAEDQQFYFSGLQGGVRGIFHPDLRIAHYKSAVKGAEEKTAATRFVGDMYRLIIFQKLVDLLGVKSDIDPMPGVFAGELAWAQACFASLLKACEFAAHGNRRASRYILEEGIPELLELQDQIRKGMVDKLFHEEREKWKNFIAMADTADVERLKKIFNLL